MFRKASLKSCQRKILMYCEIDHRLMLNDAVNSTRLFKKGKLNLQEMFGWSYGLTADSVTVFNQV